MFKMMTFSLFDNDTIGLEKIAVYKSDYQIDMYYAIPEKSINVELMRNIDGKRKLLRTFSNYSKLVFYEIDEQMLNLKIGLSDTLYSKHTIDTFVLKLPPSW
jgi:hypothetical protein